MLIRHSGGHGAYDAITNILYQAAADELSIPRNV